jgi:hypothetical protein
MASRTLVAALTVAAALAVAPVVTAGSIELAWDPSDTASGYRVHIGTSPGQYTDERNVGNTTRTTVTGLPECVTLHIAVTAYNAAGNSGYSNEVDNWGQPEIMSANPSSALQGDQFTLTLTGANFQSGTVLSHDNPNVILTGVAVISCNEIQAVATVEPTSAGVRPAEIGGVAFTVDNPDGLSDVSQPFQVLVNEARFDVNKSDARTAGRIDGQDTVWLSRRFGGQEGSGSLYHPDFDFNGDGWVDGDDLSYIASNLGSCWNGTTWMPSACQ